MREAADEASRAYKHPCQLILVIKPDKGAAFYREIKTASDHDIGIPSQCVVADNINIDGRGQGTNPQYLANVAMKVLVLIHKMAALMRLTFPHAAPSCLLP